MLTPQQHKHVLPTCPFLPKVTQRIKASDIRPLKRDPNLENYYQATLKCAHSLWLHGLPAQALLQLNHSLSLDLPINMETPYLAKTWIFKNYTSDYFLGNPVRHYQHLATRVVGKHKALRSVRAWACFHIASSVLGEEDYPRDEKQIREEKLTIPTILDTTELLKVYKRHSEATTLHEALL